MRILCLLSFLLLAACDKPPCNNKNTVFDKNPPGSDAYNTELAKQIKEHNPGNIQYWIESYEEKDNKEYMNVEVQTSDMCAHVQLDITGNESLRYYRKVKGSGYNGAELKEPKIEIRESDGKHYFHLIDVAAIFD